MATKSEFARLICIEYVSKSKAQLKKMSINDIIAKGKVIEDSITKIDTVTTEYLKPLYLEQQHLNLSGDGDE